MVKNRARTGQDFFHLGGIFQYTAQQKKSSRGADPMPRSAFTKSITLNVTEQTYNQLKQILDKTSRDELENMNALLRRAISVYLESREDVIGSQRHFQRGFQTRIDALEQTLQQNQAEAGLTLVFYLQVLLHLVAYGFYTLLVRSGVKDGISPQKLIEQALINARQTQHALDAQVQAIREINPGT
jgi:hypothetical protein